MAGIKRNERDWAGQLISWLKEAINKGKWDMSFPCNTISNQSV